MNHDQEFICPRWLRWLAIALFAGYAVLLVIVLRG
jgi:hypothetical protein